jgi:hypothetical protein
VVLEGLVIIPEEKKTFFGKSARGWGILTV